jgi:hypothetical protein
MRGSCDGYLRLKGEHVDMRRVRRGRVPIGQATQRALVPHGRLADQIEVLRWLAGAAA